jgi:hypothetical protein
VKRIFFLVSSKISLIKNKIVGAYLVALDATSVLLKKKIIQNLPLF